MQTKRNTEKLENGGIPPNIEEMLEAFALRVETLTPAERTVLQYYIEGYTIQEIASLLYISIGTARKHNTNMNRKLGITAREELMLYIDLFRKCNQLDKHPDKVKKESYRLFFYSRIKNEKYLYIVFAKQKNQHIVY